MSNDYSSFLAEHTGSVGALTQMQTQKYEN